MDCNLQIRQYLLWLLGLTSKTCARIQTGRRSPGAQRYLNRLPASSVGLSRKEEDSPEYDSVSVIAVRKTIN